MSDAPTKERVDRAIARLSGADVVLGEYHLMADDLRILLADHARLKKRLVDYQDLAAKLDDALDAARRKLEAK